MHILLQLKFCSIKKKASKLNGFEAIFVTNKLPYQNADKKLVGSDGKMRKLISKYWPDNAKFVFDLGYKKTFFPCVYDLSKAKRILNWEPSFNFDQWLIYCKKQNLDFQDTKEEYQLKRSWNFKLQKLFFKVAQNCISTTFGANFFLRLNFSRFFSLTPPHS